MSNTVEENSTVKVHYVGTLPKENGQLFDTSREEIAKQNNLFNEEREYGPLEVPMGEQQVIPGFENALIGMQEGESKTVELSPEEAYGEVDDNRQVQIPDSQFKEQGITPEPGMAIQTEQGIARVMNYDDNEGIIDLDFNHPLAGKHLKFELEVVSID